MRIALVCDYSLDYLGGAQSAFLDQAQILRDQGHDVTVISPTVRSQGAHAQHATAEARSQHHTSDGDHGPIPSPDAITIEARINLPVVDMPLVRNTTKLRERLAQLLRERRIDVVHIHSEFGLTAAAIDAARELGIPVVQTVHTFFWQAGLRGVGDRLAAAGVRWFAKWVRGVACSRQNLASSRTDSTLRGITLSTAERTQVVVSPSAHQADELRAAGLTDVVVIENASPEQEPAEHGAAHPEGSPPAMPLTDVTLPPRIAWVGRLTPEKRILEFIEAIGVAQRELDPGSLHVDIIGDGPLAAAAETAVAALPHPNGQTAEVRLLGRLSRDEVRAHMRAAHLVALTSFGFDNQPVTVVEALTEGRSVLYVDPRLREGLEAGGILADAPDAAGMAAAIVRLAQHPEEVIEASTRALNAAEVFSPERHARLILESYALASSLTNG